MKTQHPGIDELKRVRSGAASAEEADAVGRHVAECGECAASAGETFAIRESVAAFEAAFTLDDVPEEREPRPLRPVAIWTFAAAAAVAAAVFLVPWASVTEAPPRRSAPPAVQPEQPASPRIAVPAVSRPAEWDALVAETRRTGALPFPPDIRELATPDSYRGPEKGVTRDAVWPAATAIAEERPELRWPAAQGDLSVVTITAGGEEIARSEPLPGSRWRVPVPLARGRMYRWQVSVERGDESFVLPAPPAPPAIFRVISAREQEELARAAAQAGGDRLLLGLLYARAGLVEESRRELGAHEQATRDPLARRLLRQLP
ncbi:MAG TPA: hypothetical protein VF432_17390 [Thermoanaerobaculia bacterium]